MAKFSKALVPVKAGGLVKVVNAEVEVYRPAQAVKTRDVSKGGRELGFPAGEAGGKLDPDTKKKAAGNTTIIGEGKQKGSGQIWAANNGVTLRGLVKVIDAIRIASQLGADVSATQSAIEPFILSMGNKRRRQALADGGSIQRRLGGTGFGGANNKGFLKGHGKKPGGPSYGGTKGDAYDYVSKKRSSVGEAPPAAPPTGGKQLALEDTKKQPGGKQLALPDTKPGGKQLDQPLAPKFSDAPDAASNAVSRIPGVGQIKDYALEFYDGFKENQRGRRVVEKAMAGDANARAEMNAEAEAHKLKWANVLAVFKSGKVGAAINLVMSDADKWRSPAAQADAARRLEELLR